MTERCVNCRPLMSVSSTIPILSNHQPPRRWSKSGSGVVNAVNFLWDPTLSLSLSLSLTHTHTLSLSLSFVPASAQPVRWRPKSRKANDSGQSAKKAMDSN